MAIIKTHIAGTDRATGFANFFEYLTANAVPEYFDNVVLSEDGTYFSCFCGNCEFMRVTNEFDVTFLTTAGSTLSIAPTVAATTGRFVYAFKCKGGLTFRYGTTESDASYPPMFTITKAHNRDTAVVTAKGLTVSSTTSSKYFYAIALSDNAFTQIATTNTTSNTLTSLCPIPTTSPHNAGNYIDNVLYLAFYQTSSVGELEINGVKYFSNGVWCVKDE